MGLLVPDAAMTEFVPLDGASPTAPDAPSHAPSASEPRAVTIPEAAGAELAAEAPAAALPPLPTWRYWPQTHGARAFLLLWGALVVSYAIYAVSLRYQGIFDPWFVDGDMPQAVFQYWRYAVEGAFKPGDLLVDYAFVMHAPPVWWALMATLSSVFSPILAAKLLNVVAWAAACVALWWGVSRRSNAFVGFAAVALLVRSLDFTGIIAGGYARSFGPALTLAFLGTFMARKHMLTLGVLVLQAALYPSVVIPCGLAYGAYTVIAGPMRKRLRRMATMFVAGLLIIGFGKYQDVNAPEWWGSVVTLEEALQMPAWQAGGRISEAPLRPIAVEVPRNLGRPMYRGGHVLLPEAGRVSLGATSSRPHIALGFMVLCCGVWWLRRRRRGLALVDPMPWQVPVLFAAAFLAYVLARALAFKLYLPYRPLQHVWPYVFYAGFPLAVWALVINAMPHRRVAASACAVFLSVAPMFLFFGDGLDRGPATYANHSRFARTYQFVQSLPVDSVLAGEFAMVNKVPLFAWHKAYVNRVLAHPFRVGFYNETERRIIAMYKALYAADLNDVVAFAEKEHVDYFIYRTGIFSALDSGLFNPPRRILAPVFNAGKKKGFALSNPPRSSVVYREGSTLIVDIVKLKAALAVSQPPPPAEGLPSEPIPTERAPDAEDKDEHHEAATEGEFPESKR